MGELNAEPRRLQASIEAIDAEMKSLSVKHYGVHIQSAKGVAAAANGCKRTANNAARIQENLGQLATSLEQFRGIGQRVADAHARNRQTLDKHVQLLELLQIPQLMDTCSRNNLFDEALDLASFANTLQWRHRALATTHAGPEAGRDGPSQAPAKRDAAPFAGGTAVIDMIAGDVNTSAQHMRKQMLQQLRQQINLPTCLRIISLLKRLDAQERVRRNAQTTLARSGSDASSVKGAPAEPQDEQQQQQNAASAHADEIHLRFEFLDCRDAYIRSLAAEDVAAYTSRPYQSSLKLIERCRVNWFDVITQYKAIFATGDNILQELEEDGGILARWVSGKMTDFLLVLEGAISNIEDFGSLSNVLEQAMKFGLSLARVGADFRPLLMEPFKRRIFDLMINYWQQAVERAVPLLESGNWGKPLPLPRSASTAANGSRAAPSTSREAAPASNDGDETVNAPGPEDASPSSPPSGEISDADPGQDQDQESSSLAPPHDLLEFPVAAEATNIFLTSFNELRQCATPVVAAGLGRVLADQLAKFVQALQRFYDVAGDRLAEDAELEARYNRLCEVMGRVFVPHLQKCFDAVFDRANLTRAVRTFVPIAEIRDAFLALKVAPTATPPREAPASSQPQPTADVDDNDRAQSEKGNEEDAENDGDAGNDEGSDVGDENGDEDEDDEDEEDEAESSEASEAEDDDQDEDESDDQEAE